MSIERYFRSNTASNWDNTANWASTPDGTTGVSVPGIGNIAIFDASGIGSCFLDSTVNVLGFKMHEGYTGIFTQTGYEMTIGESGALFEDGIFDGGSANITISGPTNITSMPFTNTSGVMTLKGNFEWTEFPDPEDLAVIAEEIPLSAADATNKFVVLANRPFGPVALNVFEGSAQEQDEDYYMDGVFLKWDGKNLDGLLSGGDVLRVLYLLYTDFGFFHHNGTLKFHASNRYADASGIQLYDLHFSSDSTLNYTRIDSTIFVENNLILSGGMLQKGEEGNIRLHGDMSCGPNFGLIDSSRHTLPITLEGIPPQEINYESGGILPELQIDKTSVKHVIAHGTGPIHINMDFTLTDGTFDTNGLDLIAGPVTVPEMLVGRL